MSSGIVCQQCKEPLLLDASLVDLAPSAYDTIVASLPPPSSSRKPRPSDSDRLSFISTSSANSAYQNSKFTSSSTKSRPHTKPASPLPHESFVLLQDSVIHNPVNHHRSRKATGKSSTNAPATLSPNAESANPSPLSHHLQSTVQLFNLLSTRTDIDHPLCAECTQILLSTLNRQLEETKKERDGYLAFEKDVRKEREREVQYMPKEEVEKRIERLKTDENLAIQQLKEAELESARLDAELRFLEQEEKALELEEAEFWHTHNDHLLAVDQQEAQLASLRAAYAADSAVLDKLERTNVYNDTFCIGHDGVFGTINGLRLGRVPGAPVEWTEINAAWGQTLLLLYTIGRKLDHTFENNRLIPMGSFSRIEKTIGDKASYELYGSGDLHFGRLLHNRRFDIAMVAFIECLKQIMDYIRSQDSTVDFPHQVVKDKIGDVSVKLQFNQEEAWTRALRHVLLALKICLKWATSNG